MTTLARTVWTGTRSRVWALGLAAAILVAAAPLSAQTATAGTPPDVVVLRDGTMFRGTLVERGAARVVLLLATGETRTFDPAEVESAGPDSTALTTPTPSSPPAAEAARTEAPAAPPVRLHVRSHQPFRALWGVSAQRSGAYELLCAPPCDLVLDSGPWYFAVSEGIGSPDRAGDALELPAGEAWVDIEHVERKDIRAAGYALLLTAGIGLGVFLSAAIAFRDRDEIWPWIGAGGTGAATIVGLVLSFLQETSEVRLVPPGAAD